MVGDAFVIIYKCYSRIVIKQFNLRYEDIEENLFDSD